MIRFLGAVGVLVGVGAIITAFLWMLADAIGCFEDRRDRARPYTRDV